MPRALKQAIAEMKGNGIVHAIAVLTIGLTVFLFSSLFWCWNTVQQWFSDTRGSMPIMIYLKDGHPAMDEMANRIAGLLPGSRLKLIPKDEALSRLRESLERDAAGAGGFLDGFETNPLPDTIQILPASDRLPADAIAGIATRLGSLEGVERVAYPTAWIEQLHQAFQAVRLVALSLCGVMAAASVMIVSITARLTLGARKAEIAILRLLGASDSFIVTPIYLQGVLQGILGGGIGLTALWVGYRYLLIPVPGHWDIGMFSPHFLSWTYAASIWAGAIFAGTLGCIVAAYSFLRV
ncbi:cell division protein FtsX [Desulfatirhabdium butyrativorans]|uniref:cell division protein FtsX n=1 Tax=Desulfatirhabdium butyrativorans TaxID=340467 RepID=UPI00068421E2|nr:permease-like cell division protein FtsX [Desulfatirhabdium butyrativorans]